MNRFYYTVLLYLILPLVPFKLWWRGIKQPAYLKHWRERFGFYSTPVNKAVIKPVIWLHCVSVGETRAAEPLINALQTTYPHHQVLLTHGTPTGRETGEALFGDKVERVYLPYDVPFAVHGFLAHFKPAIALMMETEIWFNLIAACKQRDIPVLLLNARLSEKSALGYAKLGKLAREGLQSLNAVAAQTNDDAMRLKALGAQNVTVAGNLKFDVKPTAASLGEGLQLRKQFGEELIFLAASTREGEEALILDALAKITIPNLLTVIVPRHPQRFDAVAALLEQRGIHYQRKSALGKPAPHANTLKDIKPMIILGDTMGEMPTYYAACDIAFIGGSLLRWGGQNLIEAAHVGKPILIGEHTFNFTEASNDAVTAGAAIRVKNAEDLLQKVDELLKNKVSLVSMQQAALNFSAAYAGATERQMALIKQYV
jgi:3-deoxy-D-manno-octulosonic-acid transferase